MEKPTPADKLASDLVSEVLCTVHPEASVEAEALSSAVWRVQAAIEQDRKATARWFRSNIRLLFKALGAREQECRNCKKAVWFVTLKSGKAPPYTQDGLNHFADCPNARKHRSKR